MEVYTENWDSGLSKQSFRSYYMLPSRTMKSIKERKGKNERKKKLFSNQLIRLIAKLHRINPELAKLKKVDFSWNKL